MLVHRKKFRVGYFNDIPTYVLLKESNSIELISL